MSDVLTVYKISGDMPPNVSSSLDVETFFSGNVNQKHTGLQQRLRRVQTGVATRGEVGEAPDKVDGVSNASSYDQQLATPPSWTQLNIGLQHGYVIGHLGSNVHEVSQLNAKASGTDELNNVTTSSFYQKTERLRRLYYQLPATENMTVNPANETSPSSIERIGRSTWSATSGSYRNNSYYNPSQFVIDVPEYGKIRDIRVWVEFIHDVRGGTGPITGSSNPFIKGGTGSTTSHREHGLQGVQIALRSPNVSFKYAHPLWNDTSVDSFSKWNGDPSSPVTMKVPGLLENSYLLWAGHACEKDLAIPLGAATASWNSSDDNRKYGRVGQKLASLGDLGAVAGVNIKVYTNPTAPGPTPGGFGAPCAIYRSSGNNFSLVESTWNSVGSGTWSESVIVGGTEFVDLDFYRNGQPSIVYLSRSNASLFPLVFSTRGQTTWDSEVIYTHSGAMDTDRFRASLRFDSQDNPYVVNNVRLLGTTAETTMVSVFKKVDSVWTRQIIAEREAGIEVALDIDPTTDLPTVAATTAGLNYEGIYLFRSGTGGWSRETIVTGTSAYTDLRLAVDSRGLPHVACMGVDSSRGVLQVPMYFVSSSRGWIEQSPPVTGSAIPSVSVSGAIYYSYLDMKLSARDEPIIGWFYANPRAADYDGVGYTTKPCLVAGRKNQYGWSLKTFATGTKDYLSTTGGSFGISGDSKGYISVVGSDATNALFNNETGFLSGAAYFEYDTDIDMRTVFTDSSNVPNPRNLSLLQKKIVNDLIVPEHGPFFALVAGKYPSPSSASIARGYATVTESFRPDECTNLTGANYPWMYDDRVMPGRLVHSTTPPSASVPKEWYNGEAGQFNTKGEQMGPATIQPVYPLLDDVYVTKTSYYTESSAVGKNKKLAGFRPGLRGTEVHGKWTLLIGTEPSGSTAHPGAGIWFRNFRLEFIVDSGQDAQQGMTSREMRFKKPGYVAEKPGTRILGALSGSSSWDTGMNVIYTVVPEGHGRSVGITDDPNVSRDGFAVFTRVTGTLADDVSVASKYLKNEFGTPYIPISSASNDASAFDPFTIEERILSKSTLQEIVGQRSKLNNANTLKSVVSRQGGTRKIRDIVSEKLVSGSQGS